LSTHLRATGHHLSYGITPNTGECVLPNPIQKGWYSINLPRRDGRLSCHRWLVTHRDGLPAHRRSVSHPSKY